MESNGYEHEVFEAFKSLSTIARLADWQSYEHCGGELTPDCIDCPHYNVCQAMDSLDKAMEKLANWNC